MNCTKCKKLAIPDVEYAGKRYCAIHFMELMEKRVRKHLRITEMIDVKKEYFLVDDGSSEAKITEYFLGKIFKGHLKLKVTKKKTSSINGDEILITNLDEQALRFLDSFLKNTSEASSRVKKNDAAKFVAPLEVLLQKEIELICKILNVEFKLRVKKNILESLEKQHPEIMFSLFKSKENLHKY